MNNPAVNTERLFSRGSRDKKASLFFPAEPIRGIAPRADDDVMKEGA